MNIMDIEKLYKKAITSKLLLNDIELYSNSINVSIEDTFNEISLLFALRFNEGSTSYDDADCAMNRIWSLMLDYVIKMDICLLEPCYSIYCAFDAGEYDHQDNADPIEKYTKPTIREILESV